MVGGEASRAAVWLGVSHRSCRDQVRNLLVGQQSGNGLHDVADVLAAAEVAGQRPPVLQVRDAVLDADAPRGVRFAPVLVDFLVPVRAFFLYLRCGGVTTRPPVLAPRPPVAGIRERASGSPRKGQTIAL